jgi:hypothetical protein
MFEFEKASSNIGTINIPFSNYRFLRIPMGVRQSPDFAQEIIGKMFHHIKKTDASIDDNDKLSSSYRDLFNHRSNVSTTPTNLTYKRTSVGPTSVENLPTK